MTAKSDSLLVSREEQQSRLNNILARAETGHGSIAFIIGEAGIGKSRLAEASLEASPLKVFRGKAEEGRTPPYGPIVRVLREFLKSGRSFPKSPLNKHLALLLPEIGEPRGEVEQETLYEAIRAAFSALAQTRGCVIFLDDLQWADDATLEILPFLANQIQSDPAVILCAYRNEELPREHRIRWLRHELRRSKQLQEISLEALDPDACRVLMEHLLGQPPSPSLTKIVADKTQGLPLFVEELCKTLRSGNLLQNGDYGLELILDDTIPIPESVRDAVLLRLNGVSEEAVKLLEVAAVVGVDFDLDLLVNITGLHEGLDTLFEQGLINENQANRGSFRHALTREAILSEITWSRRRTINRQVAGYLESSGVAPPQIAEYWLGAKEHEKARLALLDLAEKSCAVYAYRDAARAANRALEIWPEHADEENRLRALERMAHCAQITGQLQDAVKAWREILSSPKVQTDDQRLAAAWRSLALVYGLLGTNEQTLSARIAAAQAFERASRPGEAAVEWLAAAARQTSLLQNIEAIAYCDNALKLGKKAGHLEVQARALGLKGNVLSTIGKHQEGIDTVKSGLSLALNHNLTEAAAEVYRRMGSTLEYASDFTGSREAFSTALDYCQSHGVDAQAQLCLSCMSYILFRTGDWKQCLEVCKDVANNEESQPGSRHLALSVMGLIRTIRGQTRPARKSFENALALFSREKVAAMEIICHWGLALVNEHDHKPEAAEEHYRKLLDLREEVDDVHDTLPALCNASTFFATHGREKETTLCAEALATMAAATGNIEALAALAYALGETALMQNSSADAIQQFKQALELFEKLMVPVEIAQTQFRLGVATADIGDRTQAVTHLRNAYRIARKLGARPLAARVTSELDKHGATAEERRSPESPERALYGGLTGRQLEILKLIESGLTNKEIAGKLFLSPRTIDMHVGHILDRLDCRSRVEAVKRAGELGLMD